MAKAAAKQGTQASGQRSVVWLSGLACGVMAAVAPGVATVAAGLLHDAVEDGCATDDEVREQFGEDIADLVAIVTEDPSIESYPARKAALRDAVRGGGLRAQLIFITDQIARLLIETNLPVAHIAASLGFADVRHFARYFRNGRGKSPLAFRQEFGNVT